MKCVKLAKTSPPSAVKDGLRHIHEMSAQHAFEKFSKGDVFGRFTPSSRSQTPGDKVATLGSDGMVYCHEDDGIFSAVLAAYNNHWKLRTSPDDWWFCVIKKVSVVIDENAENPAVRDLFVSHEGKKTLSVDVPKTCIYDIDYSSFFDQMSNEISKNVKVPEFVNAITADFTTTSPTVKMVSQISLMSSLQKYFEYWCTKCGIPAIEMLGSENDWSRLGEKLQALKEILLPIAGEIGLDEDWWSHMNKVFKELLKTYQGNPDKEWWDKIIHYEGARMSGQRSYYTGWLIEFVEGKRKIDVDKCTSGLVSVPLKIVGPSGIEEAILVAGMLGFMLHEDDVPAVQPFQGWSMLLPKHSPLRSKTAA